MELQVRSERSRNIYNQPPGFDANRPFSGESKSNFARLDGNLKSCCSIRMDTEPARVNNRDSLSFAVHTRKRLGHFNVGSNSHFPCCDMDEIYNANCQRELWDSESREEQSALDLVELLDVEDAGQDEECWLYESPKKQVFVEKKESALKWCRHVLDNPSPEMEVACCVLRNKLDQNDNEPRASQDSITMDYRLQDLTDVHIMARIQEASLRQDYVSTHFNDTDKKFGTSSSPCLPPHLLSTSRSSSPCQSPTSLAKQSCHSPQLARYHHQGTHLKLLQLAQSRAAAAPRSSMPNTPPPLRTSLRSLQAVRDSRGVEDNDRHPVDHISHLTYPVTLRPPSGISSARMGKSCWSSSLSATYTRSDGSLVGPQHSLREPSVQTTAIKSLQRTQSLSSARTRIPHPARGCSGGGDLSAHGRVFASPERSAKLAWGRSVSTTQRLKKNSPVHSFYLG